MTRQPTFQKFGDRGLLINWPTSIDPAVNVEVLQMNILISREFHDEIIETVPAYHSLAVYLHEEIDVLTFIERLKKIASTQVRRASRVKTVITIPVCYKINLAPDLNEVSDLHGVSTSEVIRLHTERLYKVYFLGFLPGFPYLGGLNKELYTPRKSNPRKLVEKGSVGIGGAQTGIYTSDSPGGWNIIGRCPLDFFSTKKSPCCLLKPGDYVRFTAISRKKFYKIEQEVADGNYQIRKEAWHD